jgi:hypothetical protein
LIPAGTGFRKYHESEVRYRPEALEAQQAAAEKSLEMAFPLLQGGDGNGQQPSAPASTPATSSALETMFGQGESK